MLYQSLHDIAQAYPDNLALRCNGVDLDYRGLFEKSSQQALVLQSQGIKPGDRVAILSSNSIEAVVAQWAIYKCNAICICLNDQLKQDGLSQILADSGASLVLCSPADLAVKLPEEPGCPVLELDVLAQKAQSVEGTWSADALEDNGDLIASIIYTSGSTGVPKGVCLTHTNLLSVADQAADGYDLTEKDSYLMVVPLHYIHGLMILMAMQRRGCSIEFMNSFMFPKLVTRKLIDSKVTGFSGVPYHFSALMDRGGFLEADLPHLRWAGITGGTIAPDRLKLLRKHKPRLDLSISYGQTECSPRITLLDPSKIDTKPDSVGSVAKGLHVEFLGDDGEPVAQGDIGELVVSGPNVMHGYWNDPVNTARVIDDKGRLHTGDLAYMDADGDIFIKGRIQAMIKSAGERIFPEELESLINRHPDVSDVAVVGITDELYGQRVEAHIVLTDATTTSLAREERIKAIKNFCLSHVPFSRAPREYIVWDAFPLKPNGKTDKQALIKKSEATE